MSCSYIQQATHNQTDLVSVLQLEHVQTIGVAIVPVCYTI